MIINVLKLTVLNQAKELVEGGVGGGGVVGEHVNHVASF